jgi:hypothetical protein
MGHFYGMRAPAPEYGDSAKPVLGNGAADSCGATREWGQKRGGAEMAVGRRRWWLV